MPITQFPAVVQLSNLNGQNGFAIEGESINDNSGYSVNSAGDINNDGVNDLVIGADQRGNYVGSSYVVFGSAKIGGTGVLSLSGLNGVNGFKINGEAVNDYSGYSVSKAGDINKDGIADLVIGAEGHNNGAGRSYVVFGRAGIGSSGTLELSSLNGVTGFKLDGESSYSSSGSSVSYAGDVNHDGVDDFIIGAPKYSSSNVGGRSYVVFGKSTIGGTGTWSLSSLNGTNGFKIDGELRTGSGRNSGQVVSGTGDVNKDGLADIIIGDPNYVGSGCGYVILGGSSVGSSGLLSLSNLNGANGFRLSGEGGATPNGEYSVSGGGDINNDSISDMVVGVPFYAANQGRSYVVFGGKSIGSSGYIALSNLNGINGFKLDGEGHSGCAVNGVADVNGDAITDLILGAYGISCLYVVFGGPTVGNSGTSLYLPGLDGTNGFKLCGTGGYDYTGWSVNQAGDVNKDGVTDLIIGAYKYNSSVGRSYVVFGDNHSPVLQVNKLSVPQGQPVILTSQDLSATDSTDPSGSLWFVISNVQYGYFDLITAAGKAVLTFNQSQIIGNQVRFTHDGSLIAPSYNVQAGHLKLAVSPVSAAQITFHLKPVIMTNQLVIHQGESVLMDSTFLNVRDDFPNTQVIFTIKNLSHGLFELLPSKYVISSFTESQLQAAQIMFVHDGSRTAPYYEIMMSDPLFTLPPAAAAVTFSTDINFMLLIEVATGVAGGVLLLLLGLKCYINSWLMPRLRQAAQPVVEGETQEVSKDLLLPIAQAVFAKIKIGGCLGYVNQSDYNEYVGAVSVILTRLESRGVINPERWSSLQPQKKQKLLNVIAVQAERQLVNERSCLSWFKSLYRSEVRPGKIRMKAENIAKAVEQVLAPKTPNRPASDVMDKKSELRQSLLAADPQSNTSVATLS